MVEPEAALSFIPTYIQANGFAFYNLCVGRSRGHCPGNRGVTRGVTRMPCADATLFGHRRLFTAIVAGCVAGVLGLTNVLGLLSYLMAMLLVRARLHTRGESSAKSVVAVSLPLRSSLTHAPLCLPPQTAAAVALSLRGNVTTYFVNWRVLGPPPAQCWPPSLFA